LRVLNAIVAAVPVRLMKRDLLFIVERVATMLDETRLEVVARNRGIKKAKDSDSTPKLLSAYIRKADEGELGWLLVEMVILHAARTQPDAGKVLKQAAEHYKVDTDAITLKMKQEFTAKEKAKTAKKARSKPQPKSAKKIHRCIIPAKNIDGAGTTGSVYLCQPVDSRPEACCRSASDPIFPYPTGL